MPALASHRHNLPAQASSFIGREQELEEIARLLRRHRLVTLTGPGGTGKTRLALRAAEAELDHFADGVWLVELAPLRTPELVLDTIAKAVAAPDVTSVSPIEVLAAVLSHRRLLLLLDNCEHLLAECAHVVADLLARCPSVAVLATSREPLTINGEAVLRVPPLRLPDRTQAIEHDHLLDYDGVRLFVERAQAAEPSFHLTSISAPPVIEICRRLDGIPLALELAAVRVRGMGVAYLGARLDDRFRLLTGGDRTGEPRQRTLAALVDWSYELLAERERVVLRRLCVFVGGFVAAAAEAVCVGDYDGAEGRGALTADAVLDDLTRLVDKSLVQLDQETGRYRLPESIHLYGRERLTAAGETAYIGRQHFVYFLRLTEDGAALVGGPDQEGWFTRLEQDHDNFRAALSEALQAGRADEAARLALGLWQFWQTHTYQREGLRWLEQVVALDATDAATPVPAALRPQLFNALGSLAHRTHQFDRATAYHAEALRLWSAAGDRAGMALALLDIGWQHFDQVEIEQATQRSAEGLALAESIGDQRLIARGLMISSLANIEAGNLAGVIPALERSLAIWRALRDMENLGSTLAVLAGAYQRNREFERAKAPLAEAARLHVRLGSHGNRISTIIGLMHQATGAADGPEKARDAARAIGVVKAWEAMTTVAPSPWWSSALARKTIEKIVRLLGPEVYVQAIDEGSNLTTAGYLALVDRITAPDPRAGDAPPAPPMPASGPHTDLTPREREVLRLVAQGLTNAQVAQELTVTPRTVNAHLTAIYAKLRVTARSGAIRYAIGHQLD